MLVLIVSLLLNAYLFSSTRQLEFQANELTRSAARQRRELSVIANQLDQSVAAAAKAPEGIDERQLRDLIQSITKQEMDSRKPDCAGVAAKNAGRLRTLQNRFRTFAAEFTTASKKVADTELSNPARVQTLAAQIKSEVLAKCKR